MVMHYRLCWESTQSNIKARYAEVWASFKFKSHFSVSSILIFLNCVACSLVLGKGKPWSVTSVGSVVTEPWTSLCWPSADVCGPDWVDSSRGVAEISVDDAGAVAVVSGIVVVCGESFIWAALWGAEPGDSSISSCGQVINESLLDDSTVRFVTLPLKGSLVCRWTGEGDCWEWGRGAIRLWSLSPTVSGVAENLGYLKLCLKLKWFFR